PLQWLVEVSAIWAPQLKAASAMRISSVATITESRFFALLHRSHTRFKRAFPAMGCNGFPAKRVELQRAGIMPTAVFMAVIRSEPKRSRRIPARKSAVELWDSPMLLGMTEDHDFAFKMIWTAAGTSSATQSALLPVTSR